MATKHQLITALLTGGPLSTPKSQFSIVNGVEREDGSNHSYNVTGYDTAGHPTTVHVRTID